MEIAKMQALIYEIRNLKIKADIYTKANEYVYKNVYLSWLNEYNALLDKYNALSELRITKMSCSEADLSATQKTIKPTTIKYFISSIETLANKIESDIEGKRLSKLEEKTPSHQMRRCFKLCVDRCPVNPELKRNRVFVAMPFSNEYLDSYNYGIVPALDGLGYEHFKADNEISNKDIMCKICGEIQSCNLVIINISGLNPNVMLEQGFAYGLGKPVIIIKDKNTEAISDLGSIEYIEYAHAYDLQQKLASALAK